MWILAVLVGLALLLVLVALALLGAVMRRLKAIEDRHRADTSGYLPTPSTPIASYAAASPTALSYAEATTGRWIVAFLSTECHACEAVLDEIRAAPAPLLAECAVFVVGPPDRATAFAARLPRVARLGIESPDAQLLDSFDGVRVFPLVLRIDSGRIMTSATTLAGVAGR